MTTALAGGQLASKIAEKVPGGVVTSNQTSVEVKPEYLLLAATFLKNTPELSFDYLCNITSVDYQDYFELIYQLTSIQHNHSLILRARIYDRKNPVVPSVVSLWKGADFQEREVYDLMGIKFEGHPNMSRIFLWEGFQGHPLRKDFLEW